MRFTVLGSVGAQAGGRRLVLPRAQTRGLLALLILDAGRTVGQDTIIDALWGGAPPSTARAQVHNAVAAIRRALAEIGAGDAVTGDRFGYRLAGPPAGPDPAEDVDVVRFETLLRQAETAAARGDPAAGRLFKAALAGWGGEPLADAAGAFVEATRAALVDRRLSAVEQLAALEVGNGHAGRVAADLAPLVAKHPLRERLRLRQMDALFHSGRKLEALRTYRAYRAALADAEGLDPGPQIAGLATAILRADASIEPPHAGALPVAVPRMLPPDLNDFTGRAGQLAELDSRLSDSIGGRDGLKVVGVAGMGGIGKTALAVRIAHRVAGRFPDGQLYMDIGGQEPGDVLARFLRALGVDSQAIPRDVDERSAMFRSRLAVRRVLLLLDNAAGAEQVRPLLPGSSSCAVLVTSRSRLTGLAGAHWLDLGVFAPEEAVTLLRRVVDEERVGAHPADATALVRQCGWLPLAVRIAGARLAARPTWQLAHLVGLLGDERRRLDRLVTGDLEVRASLALSYEGLGPQPRRLLRRLATFDVPDFAPWLAAAVLSDSEGESADAVSAHLETLVDAQLLSLTAPDATGQCRYRFHDLVRLFARELADSDDGAALDRGFGAWLWLAERFGARVYGPCYALMHGTAERVPVDLHAAGLSTAEPADWFEAERAALQAAVAQACAIGRVEVAFDLAGCLEKYFDIRGMYTDWLATNERVADACAAAGHLRGQAVMLRGLIEVTTWNTAHHSGTAMARMHTQATRLANLFDRLGDPVGQCDAAVLTAWALAGGGRPVAAVEAAERALRLAEKAGYLGGQARAHVALALSHGEDGRLDVARDRLTQALALAAELRNDRFEATVLQFMGIVHCRAGDLPASRAALDASLAISRRHGDRYAEVLTLITQARVAVREGDPRAGDLAERAVFLGRRSTMTHHVADALSVLGEAELHAGRTGRAVQHLTESVRMWRTRGWPSFLAGALRILGDALAATGRLAAAHEARAEARAVYADLGNHDAIREIDALAVRR
ncbi:BTAD domain-containing putative transcriptional regulator [Actinoplanes sp. GCM10030250]|uniref:AfsR/SARP family transcriptional regulator n=1 Tax=Actinoplanes sp. GCM10030250 TaxID=3273376 RepID=UPI00361A6919